jgi:hypothetical protein
VISGGNPNGAITIFEDPLDSRSGSDGYEIFSLDPADNTRLGSYP